MPTTIDTSAQTLNQTELSNALAAAGVTDFCNVQVALRIVPTTMRSLSRIGISAPACDQFAIKRPDRHAVTAALLYDVRNIVIEEDISRTNQISPLV